MTLLTERNTDGTDMAERLVARAVTLALSPIYADEAAEQLLELCRGDVEELGDAWQQTAWAAIFEPGDAIFRAEQILSDAFEMAGGKRRALEPKAVANPGRASRA